MKKVFMACALILSLCFMGGCSKDDGPSSGAKVKGNFKVDGKKVDLKYGYVYYGDTYTEYNFFDRDMLKYSNYEIEEMDFDYSCLWISYDNRISQVDEISLEYKINDYKETGTYYDNDDDDIYKYLSFSDNNGKVKFSSKSIPLKKYNYDYKKLGEYQGSFSVDGKTKDIYDNEEDFFDTRGIIVTEISTPKEISFIKSLRHKHKETK